MKHFILQLFLIVSVSFAITSCKKYLDKNPQKEIAVPATLSDLQALLNNSTIMNQGNPGFLELIADNYYVTTEDWKSNVFPEQRLNYIWDKEANSFTDWQSAYQHPIYYSNIVLDLLPTIETNGTNIDIWNNIKGAALFYRSLAFLQLAQLYCSPFSASASTDYGLVLKLSGYIGEKYVRSSVQQTYDQITNDLRAASELLPDTAYLPTRPTKTSAFGALARTYLFMRDYTNAGQFADAYLQRKNELMNYNNISNFPKFNVETAYYSFPLSYGLLYPPVGKIDTSLYHSYDQNDLRKSLFFIMNNDGTYSFNGSYCGLVGFFPFDGITTDEMYLVRAESYARKGDRDAALKDLNTLLGTRWKTGTFNPVTANTNDEALQKILVERRKELVYRGLRWSDIRRLNLEGANIHLTRMLDGVTYSLPSNDLRTVLLIPREEINLSGISQNPR